MHSKIRTVFATATLALCVPFASATVLTFDDIVGADDFAVVPTNYGGLDWSAAGWSVYTFEQAPYTPRSGYGYVTTDFGSVDNASIIRFLAPTVFEGAWFSGYSDTTVRFDLYLNDLLVASSLTLTPSDMPTFLAAGFDGAIDAVVVSSPLHAFYVMDDFSFVPEPGTLALVFAGLGIGVATSTRRRRQS